MNEEAKILAKNLKVLMEYHQESQASLAKRSGLSQKTISNMCNPGDDTSTNLAKIALVAKAYKLQTWHLLLPNAPPEIMLSSSIEKHVSNYMADPGLRDFWARINETAAEYVSEKIKSAEKQVK